MGLGCPHTIQDGCGHGMSTAPLIVDTQRPRQIMGVDVDIPCPRPPWTWDVDRAGVWTWDVRACGHGVDMGCPRCWFRLRAWTCHVHKARDVHGSTGCGHGTFTANHMVRAVDLGCPRWSRLKAWAWDVHAAMVWTWDVRGQGGRGHGMSAARVGVDMGCPRCPYPLLPWTYNVHTHCSCPHPCCADIPCPRPTHKIMLWTSHVHTSAWTSHVHALFDMGCPDGQGVDMKCPRHLSMGWVWTWDVPHSKDCGWASPLFPSPPLYTYTISTTLLLSLTSRYTTLP